MPNTVLNLRYHRDLFVDVEDHVERVVADRLIAGDPEAGEILRYAIKRDAHYAGRRDLKALTAKYPENEFFLAELAARSAEAKKAELPDVLASVDRLLALDPNNAHHRYLRGWVLLQTPGGKERISEALHEFDVGNRLPQFSFPYRKYKQRVDRIAERAVLRKYDRPQMETFYPSLAGIIDGGREWQSMDKGQRRELIAVGEAIADRVMQNAYDIESLCAGGEMMKRVEQVKLRDRTLTESESKTVRLRLAQAAALSDLRYRWDDGLWLTHPSVGKMIPLFLPVWLLAILLAQHVRSGAAVIPPKERRSGAFGTGITMLVALTTFIALYRQQPFTSHRAITWLEIAWMIFWFSWVHCAEGLAGSGKENATARTIRSKPEVAYGLLWLNGTLLLMISNSTFLWSGRFVGWSRGIPVLAVWLVFCALHWASTHDRQPVFGRVRRTLAVIVAISVAATLLALDAFGTNWHYESRAYAEPLTRCAPLPAATQETYEKTVLKANGAHYTIDRKPYPVPRNAELLAPDDMKEFLMRRQAEGKGLSRGQLQALLQDSLPDARPIISEAIRAGSGMTLPLPQKDTVRWTLCRIIAPQMALDLTRRFR